MIPQLISKQSKTNKETHLSDLQVGLYQSRLSLVQVGDARRSCRPICHEGGAEGSAP